MRMKPWHEVAWGIAADEGGADAPGQGETDEQAAAGSGARAQGRWRRDKVCTVLRN